jgi:hypothetical protein
MALVCHGAVATRTGYDGATSIRGLASFGATLLEYVKDAGLSFSDEGMRRGF